MKSVSSDPKLGRFKGLSSFFYHFGWGKFKSWFKNLLQPISPINHENAPKTHPIHPCDRLKTFIGKKQCAADRSMTFWLRSVTRETPKSHEILACKCPVVRFRVRFSADRYFIWKMTKVPLFTFRRYSMSFSTKAWPSSYAPWADYLLFFLSNVWIKSQI